MKFRKLLTDERGVTLIESALALPFFIGFVFIFTDLCYLGYYKITLQHAVNTAARAGVPGWDDESVHDAVNDPLASFEKFGGAIPTGSAQESEIYDNVHDMLIRTALETGLVTQQEVASVGFENVLSPVIVIEDRNPVGFWIRVSASKTVDNLTPLGSGMLWLSLGRTTIELNASAYARIENPPTKG